MRFSYILLRFFTKRRELHTPLKYSRDRPANRGVQAQVLAGIGARNTWDGTSPAKIGSPVLTGRFEQAAFFYMPAAEIIAIKMGALSASWGFHT